MAIMMSQTVGLMTASWKSTSASQLINSSGISGHNLVHQRFTSASYSPSSFESLISKDDKIDVFSSLFKKNLNENSKRLSFVPLASG